MTMIERVARALHRCSWADKQVWEDAAEGAHEYWREYARAAIAAMREPTDEMLEAVPYKVLAMSASGVWKVMIDAALESDPK